MKQALHITNIILCIASVAAGILLLVFGGQAVGIPASLFYIIGGVQITLALLMLFIGAFLPKDARHISRRAQVVLKIVLLLAALGNQAPGNRAAYDLANGEVKLQRFWEPAFPLTWLFFEAALFFFVPQSGALGVTQVAGPGLMALLFLSMLCWKVLEYREKNIFRWSYVIVPSLVIVGIFAVIFLITFIQDYLRGPSLREELAETKTEIQETLDAYQEGADGEVPGAAGTDGSGASEYADLDIEGVVKLVKSDAEGELYYRWLEGEDDVCSMVVWSGESEDVVVYQFREHDGLYDYMTTFVSGTMSKEDVEGKEDGVIP